MLYWIIVGVLACVGIALIASSFLGKKNKDSQSHSDNLETRSESLG